MRWKSLSKGYNFGIGVGGYGGKNLGGFEYDRRVHSGELWRRGEVKREEERL